VTAEEAILTSIAAGRPGASVCPAQAARLLAPDAWRPRLSEVRAAAVKLALERRIAILRKGKPVDPLAFKGVYRLAAPLEDGVR
jgi:hypothetical protein